MLSAPVQPSVRLSSAHLQRQFLTVIDDNVSPPLSLSPLSASRRVIAREGKEGGRGHHRDGERERGDSIENNGS